LFTKLLYTDNVKRKEIIMPLVSMVNELKKAQAEKYAVPLFLTFEMMGFEGTLAALEESRAPGIIGIFNIMMDKPNIRAFVQYICARAQDSPAPAMCFMVPTLPVS